MRAVSPLYRRPTRIPGCPPPPPLPSHDQVAGAADAAAALLERDGWRQGGSWTYRRRFVDGHLSPEVTGPYDLLGAVITVDHTATAGVTDAVVRRAKASPVTWNDRAGRTRGEVVALLRDVARDLRAGVTR